MSFVGIDNGVTGAVAILRPGREAEVLRVPTRKVGEDNRIDCRSLWSLLFALGESKIVFEQGQKQPKWGCIGNFANGRSHGVVETVVELLKVPYRPVNPKDWQADVFKGIRKADMDTKSAAKEFCRRTFPNVSLVPPRCRTEDDNFADALCMAWWAKHHAF